MDKRTWGTRPLNQALSCFPATSKMVENKKKIFHLEPKSNYPRIKATYPYFDTFSIKTTLSHYQQYITKYNAMVKLENLDIALYNDEVLKHLKKTKLSYATQQIVKMFPVNYKKLNSRDYNKAAEKMNTTLDAPVILKKRIQRVTTQAKEVFLAALYLYNKQFSKLNQVSKAINSTAHRSLIKLDFNSSYAKALKLEDDAVMLDFTNQTIRNHRKRLQEAGVFVDYSFHGQEHGVKLHINNQILVIFDENIQKHVSFDSQRVKEKESEKLTDTNLITINKYNIEDKAKKRSSLSLTSHSSSFTGTHHCKGEKNSPGAENFVLDSPKNSTDFKRYLIPVNILSTKLAKGNYFTPPEIEFNELAREATNGTLTREEFSVMLVNYFFMKCNKLYQNRNASFGSWRIAIELWQKHRFLTKTGKLMHKDVMLSSLNAYLHGLNEVYKFCEKNPDYRTLYPNQYFDMARTDEKSGGFEFYARAKWISYLQHLDRIEKQENKSKSQKENRLKQANYNRRLDKQTRKWLNGKISYEALLSYSAYNLPKTMQEKLPELIANISERFNSKKAA